MESHLSKTPLAEYKEKMSSSDAKNNPLEEILFEVGQIRPQNQVWIVTSPLEADKSITSLFEIETMISFLSDNTKTLLEYFDKMKNKPDKEFLRNLYCSYRENKYVDTMDSLKKQFGQDYDVARFLGFFGAYPTERMAKERITKIQKAGYPFQLDTHDVSNTFVPFNLKEMTNINFKDEMLGKLYENSVTRVQKAKKEVMQRKAALLHKHDVKTDKEKQKLLEISDFTKEEIDKKNAEIDVERKVMITSTSGTDKMRGDLKSLIIEEVKSGNAKMINPELIKTLNLPEDIADKIKKAHG